MHAANSAFLPLRAGGFEDFALARRQALNPVRRNLVEDGIDFVADKILGRFVLGSRLFTRRPGSRFDRSHFHQFALPLAFFEGAPIEVSEAQPAQRPGSRVESPTNVGDASHDPAQVRCVSDSAIRRNDREEYRDAGHSHQEVLALYRKNAKEVDFALGFQYRKGGQQTKDTARSARDTAAEITRNHPTQETLQKAAKHTARKIKLQEVARPAQFLDEL